MNALILRCNNGEEKSLLIQSTLDQSYWMPKKINEEVQFDANALLIVKEKADRPHLLRIKVSETDSPGAGVVFRSTRRGTFVLRKGSEHKVMMQPGEVLQIRGERAMDPRGAGPMSVQA